MQLFSSDGAQMQVASVTNPNGESPAAHPPEKVVDDKIQMKGSKWLDLGFARNRVSTLVLAIGGGEDAGLSEYELWTVTAASEMR